jgi:replication factor A1
MACMKISELQPRQGKVELEATIVEKQPPREFNKPGMNGKVCNARISDGSGTITLTLWNDDCEKYQQGDKIKISNGYVGEWQGELQLGAGKFGKLEKL